MPETQSTLGNKDKTHTSVCVITKGIEAIHIDVNINIQKTKKKTKKKYGTITKRVHLDVASICTCLIDVS